MRAVPTTAWVAAPLALLLASGCAGPSTFVSPQPPPETHADAWFLSDMPSVHAALRGATVAAGMSIVTEECSATVVVAEKHQLPYIDAEVGAPAAGRLPVYRMRAALSRPGDTHVRVAVRPLCPACDGATPYEWEYPVDLIRTVLEGTRSSLAERRPRLRYPPRYAPPRWRR